MAYTTIGALWMNPLLQKELTATAVAITPGFLVERTSAGTVQAHSNAGQNAVRMFAIEDANQGKEISDNYAVSAKIQVGIFNAGDEVVALLADGENAAIGSFLESNGDGYLKVHAASSAGAVEYPEAIVGQSLVALDFSGSSGADPASQRLLIEIV